VSSRCLYRSFSIEHFTQALPPTVRAIAVIDCTKEPGTFGEPLYLDVVTAFAEVGQASRPVRPKVISGRYGLCFKEFTPAMVKALFDELSKPPPKKITSPSA
jgi:pyruvate-ferredoxin/flavodoxin oxidoreductase